MAEIHLNGEEIFMGNQGDFYPECQGQVLPKEYPWHGVSGFIGALKKYITDSGKKVTIKKQEYSFE